MTPLPVSKSASRRYRLASKVAVLRDQFAEAGIWPWPRSWIVEIELAHDEALRFDVARRTMSGLLRWLYRPELIEDLVYEDTPLLRMLPRGTSFFGIDRTAAPTRLTPAGVQIPGLPRI